MKKRFVLFSLIFVCLLCFCLNINNFSYQAKTIEGQKLILLGQGEVEVQPDTIKINYGIKTRGDSLLEGQNKLKEIFDNVVNKLKTFDENASTLINYSTTFPVNQEGVLSYVVDASLTTRSSKVDKTEELLNTIISAGATNINHTCFELKNKQDSYISALTKAKENAEVKAKAFGNNLTLQGLIEESVYCCESSFDSKIKICARVKAIYDFSTIKEEGSVAVGSAINKSETPESIKNDLSVEGNKEIDNKTDGKANNQADNKTNEKIDEKGQEVKVESDVKQDLLKLNNQNNKLIVQADDTLIENPMMN